MATNNAINLSQAGLARYDGAGSFTGVTVTQHDLLIGAASNGITSVAPSATVGIPVVSAGAAADPTFGTAVVPGGGTGLTSTTAYAVVAGGTTSTGNLQQVSGVGTSGQVLTSAGAGALPVWAAASAPTSMAPYLNTTGTTQTMAVNEGYISNNAGLVTFTPPASCAVGTIFGICGNGTGGWTVDLAANSQTINLGSSPATTSISSTNRYDSVQFVCTVANTTFSVIDSVGNITVV